MITYLTRGTGGNSTSATTLVITPIGNLAVGTLGVLCIALDNSGSGGATTATPATITDSVGNTWTRRQNAISDPGAANAGVEGVIYTAPIVTALTTANNITITWAGAVSVPSKAWTLTEVSGDGALSYIAGGVANGLAAAAPTVTSASITAGDAIIGFAAGENVNTWTADADTTNGSWANTQSTGFGTTTAAVSVISQTKVVTATGTQTYNPGRGATTADWGIGWIQIRDTVGSGLTKLIQAASQSPDTFGGSATATFSTGATAGNKIILFAAFDKDHGTMTLPAGFNVIASKAGTVNNIGGTIAYKTAVGGETSFNVTVTNTTSSKHTLAVYEWENLTVPENIDDQADSGDTAVLSIAAPAITPGVNGTIVMAFACGDSTSVPVGYSTMRNWSNGFNERYQAGVGGSPFNNLATKKVGTATSTGTTFTFASGTGDQALVFIAAFKEGNQQTLSLTADTRSYALTGVDVTLTAHVSAHTMTASPAAYTLSGKNVGLGDLSEPVKLIQTAKNFGTDAFTGTISATFPRPTTPGNLLFLVCGIDKNAVSVTQPSGFTVIESNVTNVCGGLIAYKIADGTEATMTVTLGSALVSKPTLFVQEWDGFTGTPLDQSNDANSLAVAVNTLNTGNITLGVADSVVFAVGITDSCNEGWAHTRAWSDDFDEIAAGTRGSGPPVSIAKKVYTASASTVVSATHSYTGATDEMAAFIVSFATDGSSFPLETTEYKEITLINEFSVPHEVTGTSGGLLLPFVPTAGNLLILTIATSTTSGAFTLPSGFTAIKSYTADANMGSVIAYKVADGTEELLSFSWVNTGLWAASCLEYAGAKAANFLGYYNRSTVSATSVTTATATCTSTKSMLINVVCGDGDGRTGTGTGVSQSGVFTNAFTKVAQCSVTATTPSISVGQRVIVGRAAHATNFSWTGSAITLHSYMIELASVDGSDATSTDGEAISGGATLVQQAEAEATGFSTTITPTLGAGATTGNVLIFVGAFDKSNTISSLPSGFTLIDSHVSTAAGGVIAYKVATGGETALTLTLNTAGISRPGAWVGEFSGMDTSSLPGSLIGANNKANSGAGTVQTINPGTINTTETYGYVLAFATADSWQSASWDSGSWSNGFTTLAMVGSAGDGRVPISVAYKHTVASQSVSSAFTTTQTADEMCGIIAEFGTTSDGSGGAPALTTGNVTWKASGAITDTTATGIVCASASGTYSLKVYRTTDNTLITTVGPTATTAASTNHLVKFAITGLTADTQYECIPNDGTDDLTGHAFFFKTFPSGAADLKFVHYSCNNLATNARFQNLAAKDPDLWICMGDWHYSDINSTTESNYYPAYVTNYTSTNQKDLYTAYPFTRIWDDHDFSGNDSDSSATGRTQSAATHRKFIPHYTLTDSVAVYHSFVAGRVRFIIMDVRSEKTTTQQISATQLQWVKDEITAASEAGQIIVLGSGTPWIGTGVNNDTDTWGAQADRAIQRAEIGTHIRGLGLGNSTFLISGDAHMLAYDDGTNNTYGTGGGTNFRVFHGAALGRSGSIKGGPYSGGSQSSGTGTEAEGQYGEISIFDDGGDTIGVQWVGRVGTADSSWQTVNFTLDVPITGYAPLEADPGTFALTGVDATLTADVSAHTMTAAPASYILTGSAATLISGLQPWFAMGQSAGNVDITRVEISDMSYGVRAENAGYLWVIEDGSTEHFVAINQATGAVAGIWTVSGITAADVESMSSCSIGGTGYLFLGDTGDNSSARANITIHRVVEPAITGSDGTINTGIESIVCEFPAGNLPSHKDVETIIADPLTGDLYIITKRISPVLVYRLPYSASYVGTQTLEYIGTVAAADATFNTISTVVSGNNGYVIGGCISPDGTEIMLKSYDSIYYWKRAGGETIGQALTRVYDKDLDHVYVGGGRTRYRALHPEQEPQGEAVTFDRDGVNFYTLGEFVSTEADPSGARRVRPLFFYERLSEEPTIVSFQQGTSSYSGCTDTYIDDGAAGSNFVDATVLIADIDYSAFPAPSSITQALIKWDISTIPTGVDVNGAYIEFYVTTEGKQFAGHKMLQSWDAATITWTSSGGIALNDIEAVSTEAFKYGTVNASGALDTYTGYVRINLSLALVQDWIDNPSSNHGLLLVGGATESTGDGLQFASSENATVNRRPNLFVSYVTTGAQTLTLTATPQSYTLTGVAAAKKLTMATTAASYSLTAVAANKQLSMAATSRSYALTGVAATKQLSMATTAASYSLTGIAATKRLTMATAVANYTLTGVAANKQLTMATTSRSYALAGIDAGLVVESANSTTLTADSRSYTLTAVAANVTSARKLTADAQAYSLTGVDVVLERSISVEIQPYILTGIDVVLSRGKTLVADAQSYVLTGVDNNLQKHLRLTADAQSYSLTGVNAGLVVESANSSTLVADPRSYTLTAVAANITSARKLTADAQSYSLTGIAATKRLTMATTSRSYTLTGVAAVKRQSMAATTRSYVLTGVDNNLQKHLRLTADARSYALTGIDAGFVIQNPGSDLMTADPQSYSLTAVAANITSARKLTAETGTLALTGNETALADHLRVTAAPTAYTLTAVAAGITSARKLTADSQSYTASAIAAGLSKTGSLSVIANTGAFTLTGVTTGLTSTRKLTADTRSYTLTGVASNKKVSMAATTRSYALTGVANNLRKHLRMTATVASFSLSGIAANKKLTIATTSRSYALTTVANTFSITRAYRLTADTRAYTLTGVNATVAKNWVMPAAFRSYTLTGVANNFVKHLRLTADSRAYSLNGTATGLGSTSATNLNAETRAYTLTANAANITSTRKIPANVQAYTLTRNAINTIRGRVMPATTGNVTLTLVNNGLTKQVRMTAATGSCTTTAAVTTLRKATTVFASGLNFQGNIGTVTISAGATAIISGFDLVTAVGNPSFSNETIVTLVGVESIFTVGTPTVQGAALITPIGTEAQFSIGNVFVTIGGGSSELDTIRNSSFFFS